MGPDPAKGTHTTIYTLIDTYVLLNIIAEHFYFNICTPFEINENASLSMQVHSMCFHKGYGKDVHCVLDQTVGGSCS